MTTYPRLKKEYPTLLKITAKDGQLEELHYRTEKHDHENTLKSLKIDNDFFKKKYKSLNKKSIINNH